MKGRFFSDPSPLEPPRDLLEHGHVRRGEPRRIERVFTAPRERGDVEGLGRRRFGPARRFVKQEEDRLLRVFVPMKRDVDDVPDVARDSQLFEELASQRLARILSRLRLAAGKFPHPGEVRPLLALREEHAPVLDHDPCRHDDRSHDGSLPQLAAKTSENPPPKG